eukprot:2597717-Rhodomonas_salina.5
MGPGGLGAFQKEPPSMPPLKHLSLAPTPAEENTTHAVLQVRASGPARFGSETAPWHGLEV